jgi:hypothetical protein
VPPAQFQTFHARDCTASGFRRTVAAAARPS